MRKITMVSTKDHFLYLISCEYVGEEIWAESHGKAVGFLVDGSYTTFTKSGEDWTKHSTVVSPAIRTKPSEVTMGWVAASDDTLNISIAAKELSTVGVWANLTPQLANTDELSTITENTNTAFVIAEQCFATTYRDLNTFDATFANTFIPDSEVTII
jgi:hypothetical protein